MHVFNIAFAIEDALYFTAFQVPFEAAYFAANEKNYA